MEIKFICVDFQKEFSDINDYEIIDSGQELEENEIIDGFVWKSRNEVIEMCLDRQIREERTIGVLLSYILKDKH